ncbi:aminotransferase class III-fold pyridoxal phosphate-dependent enzyme [Cryobacterium sp. TMT2-10]|uniref:aminotransferase class III-fold pyridoxal phosphate-dependent enzyme n=1 Tax=Cryobacterium sp. TMT2-10 TaxID=1259244 RepID=UPI00106B02F0|nr:aminotransferase class III-fold pyridoxal phosphate-dependent enzyme [Cryobacterium sp. TMT2-10]TFD36121.1 aminotransferase class III-fold pyridoxal phosphate-dependent enzyme [Cryobacterium sp. TMT2-10]
MDTATVPQTRLLRTAIPGPRSSALHAERVKQVSSGFGIALPVFIDRAEGGILQDVDGNRIIDFASGIAVTSVGAANPLVQARVTEQLARFSHTCFMVTEYDSFTAVCAWLNAHTPGDFEKRTALFSTGSEAVENAIKIARAATGRAKALVFDDAYHGRSLLTMAMTAKEKPYKITFGPFPTEIVRAPMAAPLRWPSGAANATAEALAGVEAVLAEQGPETFAAMVIEPIQGEGGFIVPAPGFLAGLRDIAARHGIVFVLDEVQAGMGRTGTMFASEHEGVAADLLVTGKALAGGLPLTAVTGRVELMNAVHTGGLGGTYAGNPLACAAALGVFEAFENGDLLAGALRIESTARRILEPLVAEESPIVDFRGRGAMLAIEFADRETLEPRPELAAAVASLCHQQGVLVLVCGTYGNVIRLLPPLVIGQDLLEDGLAVLRAAVESVYAEASVGAAAVHA